ncbi:nucleoside-diphosphate kinase, partial [Candidatus Poribacteria bacterium]|nr:nucleoside-diphosphate kinase [Candidatus Poribacteria bacterium]
ISRLERRGLKITALKMMKITTEDAKKLYEPHKGKVFYEGLLRFMVSGPVVIIALEGNSAVKILRNIIGALQPEESLPGSIRGDYAMDVRHSVIHGSDSPENAKRELAVFFQDNDYLDYNTCDEDVLYSE